MLIIQLRQTSCANTTEGEDHNFNSIKNENIDQSSSSDHNISKLHHT